LACRADVAHCVFAEDEAGEAGDELGCVLGDTDVAGPPGVTLDDAPPAELAPDAQAESSATIATPPQVAAVPAAARRPARVIPMTMPP
jgi:hypothetical protein